jgi:hypothetical protein
MILCAGRETLYLGTNLLRETGLGPTSDAVTNFSMQHLRFKHSMIKYYIFEAFLSSFRKQEVKNDQLDWCWLSRGA